ncbi:MAG: flagellar basal body P-ring protein FlgI [Bryobacterales bacterium]|nr:flagellar basal body P-ring protein FlgI [Bryobacterales bacterium]
MKAIPIGLLAALLAGVAETAVPTRIKDLAAWEGVRDNQLIGYGLVVGLAGTGDRRQTVFSVQTLTNMLERMGLSVPPAAIRVNNTAAVMVTATLPPFAQPGTRIDVTVASAGDASNLQGGLLLLTPLRAATGEVFAAAQGAVVTGGFAAGGRGGATQTLNHPTVGRIAGGGLVERPAPSVFAPGPFRLQLRRADFATAARIAEAVNKRWGAGEAPVARAENSALVVIEAPDAYRARPVEFIAQVESLGVEADRPARVVVNERTGTVVMGKEVRIAPVAILHGALSVEIQTALAVSQPSPLSSGETAVVPQTSVTAREERARNVALQEGATVDDLVRALVSIGSTPRDVIAILQNLKAAGALDAELEIL